MLKKNIKRVLGVVVLSSMVALAYAEDAAPVYDADNYPPQFDGQTDAGLNPDSSAAAAPSLAPTTAQNNVYTPPATQSMSLDQRIARMEQQVNNLEHKDLAGKIDTL